jgi:hypothetical protein
MSVKALKGTERNTVTQTNKYSLPRETRLQRIVRHLHEWRARHARTVQDQVMRAVAYSVGSGAVSLIVVWVETRY